MKLTEKYDSINLNCHQKFQHISKNLHNFGMKNRTWINYDYHWIQPWLDYKLHQSHRIWDKTMTGQIVERKKERKEEKKMKEKTNKQTNEWTNKQKNLQLINLWDRNARQKILKSVELTQFLD